MSLTEMFDDVSRSVKKLWGTYVFALATTLTVMWPLWKSGYALTLDLAFTPTISWPLSTSNGYLFHGLLHLVNLVIAADVVEKSLLMAILGFSAVGMYQLAQSISFTPSNFSYSVGSYVSSAIYTINPFTYERFMAGQYEVLLGYTLLPWFTRSLFRFLDDPGLKTLSVALAWSVSVSVVSVHAIGFMLLIGLVAFVTFLWAHRTKPAWPKQAVLFSLIGLVSFVLLNGYWLFPTLLGNSSISTALGGFSGVDRTAFATAGSNFFSQLVHVLSLEGFWAESRTLFYLPQDVQPFWPVLTVLVWSLVVIGVTKLIQTKRWDILSIFGLIGSIAAILATGLGNGWLAAHIPFFSGYREPQKFVALVALSYAVFIGFGVDYILTKLRSINLVTYITGSAFLLLIPLLWTRVMLFGFDGQLHPVEYPSGWNSVNNRLSADRSSFKTLFLPWHEYMYFSFAGRIIANPASQFFDKTVISSDNPEFGNLKPPVNALDTKVNKVLTSAGSNPHFAQDLSSLDIKYIIVDHQDDGGEDNYIGHTNGLKLIDHTQSLDLYLNTTFVGDKK